MSLALAYETGLGTGAAAGDGSGRDPGGVPLVLLHAFPLDRAMWRDAAEALAGLVPTVLVDLPGLGDSPLPDGPTDPSLDEAADGVAGVLDRLGHDRAVLGGVSMGGYVAMAFARRHPERLAGLALLDTMAGPDTRAAAAGRERVAAAVTGPAGTRALLPLLDLLVGSTTRLRRAEVLRRVRESLLAARPEGVAWSERAMAARPDSAATLSALTVPVAVVVGEEDTLTGPEHARAMQLLLSDAVLTIVPGAGHLAPLERPDEVARALIALTLRIRP
ncbi:MAG TPA: alpha/beta fold hydrolase [Streptosporangiaceae bacterium]|nr:alpha/beta fold hydrolase [Streptosporangiaceae bacterium]